LRKEASSQTGIRVAPTQARPPQTPGVLRISSATLDGFAAIDFNLDWNFDKNLLHLIPYPVEAAIKVQILHDTNIFLPPSE
jgi:hypothetical protein